MSCVVDMALFNYRTCRSYFEFVDSNYLFVFLLFFPRGLSASDSKNKMKIEPGKRNFRLIEEYNENTSSEPGGRIENSFAKELF